MTFSVAIHQLLMLHRNLLLSLTGDNKTEIAKVPSGMERKLEHLLRSSMVISEAERTWLNIEALKAGYLAQR